MREVVIVEAVRTALGKRDGALRNTRPDDLLSLTLDGLMRKAQVPPELVEDIIVGCVTQIGEQGWNIARLASLSAGFPPTVPAVTVNRMCGSSQQSIHFASQEILSGDADIVIAAGVESMSRVKMMSDGSDLSPRLTSKYPLVWQGTSAEMMAERWNLSRQELDQYSLESHQRAAKAIRERAFESEIFPVPVTTDGGSSVQFAIDEAPRPDTSMERLSALKPAFQDGGKITAGNSSQISDGAAALLLMSSAKARELNLKPRARIVARSVVGSDPVLMLDGIIPATGKALERAQISLDQIDLFEVNEAFASVVLAWTREFPVNPAKVNTLGGAIALGHPLGASGCRMMVSLLHALAQTGGRFGLETMCIAHGMATATIIENISSS